MQGGFKQCPIYADNWLEIAEVRLDCYPTEGVLSLLLEAVGRETCESTGPEELNRSPGTQSRYQPVDVASAGGRVVDLLRDLSHRAAF